MHLLFISHMYRMCNMDPPLRRDRSSSAPRSVRFRLEIGRVPPRDRSASDSRSVELRPEIGPLPARDRSPPTTEPRAGGHHLRPSTQSSRSAQDRDRTHTRASTPSMRTGKKSVGRMRRLHSLPAFNQCSRHTCQQPRSSEVRRFRTTSAKKCATTPQPDHRRPNPGRKRTDLEPEVDRSRSGVRPISARRPVEPH